MVAGARDPYAAELNLTPLLIAVFAVFGALARYFQSSLVASLLGKDFPYATLSINLIGSFLMGFLFYLTLERLNTPASLRAGILTGFLGSYTTFSTFSIETFTLVQEGRIARAAIYALVSVGLGLLAVTAGVALGRR